MPGTKTNREWTEALEYTKDRDGNPCPVNNVGNLVTILENDERLRARFVTMISLLSSSMTSSHGMVKGNGLMMTMPNSASCLRTFVVRDSRRTR